MLLYLDLIWLLNLLFDWTILLLVGWLTKSIYSNWRIFFGALFASLIIPLTIGMGIDWLNHPIAKLFYSIGIILIAFPYQRLKTTAAQFLAFYLVNFTIGGGIYGLTHFLDTTFPLDQLAVSYGNMYSWLTIIILFPIVWWITKDQFHRLTLHRINENKLYRISLRYRDKTVHIQGFYDSGNQLKHPINRRPVILLDERTARTLFGPIQTQQLLNQHHSENESQEIQSIPYQAVGGEDLYMSIIPIDRVTIHEKEKSINTKRLYVGVQRGEFSHQLDFQALLGPSVFQSKSSLTVHSEEVS